MTDLPAAPDPDADDDHKGGTGFSGEHPDLEEVPVVEPDR